MATATTANTSTTSELPISAGVLEMKFMQRTRTRLEEEKRRKEEEALKKSLLGNNTETGDEGAKKRPKIDGEDPTGSPIIFENRYEVLEDLSFGRKSFGGFNPEVEKLMKYYEDLKNGIKPKQNLDIMDDVDVTDSDMAIALGGSLSTNLKKKFEKVELRKQRRREEHHKTLIDETSKEDGQRGRKRKS